MRCTVLWIMQEPCCWLSEQLMELLKKRLHWNPIFWYGFKSGSLEAQPIELALYSLLSVLNVMLTWQLQSLKSWWEVKWKLVCDQKYLCSVMQSIYERYNIISEMGNSTFNFMNVLTDRTWRTLLWITWKLT